jgi:hypothetical protein
MIKKNSKKTLDTHHNIRINDFINEKNILQEKETQLDDINNHLEKFSTTAPSNLSETEFQTYMNLKDQKLQIEQELNDIRSSTNEIDYYVNTADLVFKYYDIVENGNSLENENAPIITENSILKFFKSNNSNNQDLCNNKDDDRATILDKYMQFTDSNYLRNAKQDDMEICPVCECKSRILLMNDGLMYCNECHTIETIIVDHEKPSYKDPPKEIKINLSQTFRK